MSFIHQRDGPTVYLLLGMGQPLADGAKLLLKSMSTSSISSLHTVLYTVVVHAPLSTM